MVGAVSEGSAAVGACREFNPDVCVMDFRLPGMDGVETTIALARDCPSVAVVCLTASASPRELDALLAAGAVACLRKDQELDEIVAAIRSGGEFAPVNLTAENTAVVLDSTADFPDAQIRFPNMRVVPLYVRFGEESFRDYVELDPHGFYERLRTAAELPTTSQPTPQDFLSTYHALSGYERIYSLHISSRLSGTFQSASLAAAEVGRRPGAADRHGVGLGRHRDARDRDPGAARAGDDRRGDRGGSPSDYRERGELLFTVDTLEFLAKGGRIGRARALAGNLLNVKPILTIQDGEVVPLARARGRQKALEEFRKRFEEASTDGAGLAVAIAHAEADETVEQLRAIVLASRPQAEIKLVTSLGAVVGTHAGPGTVGFFWFQDASLLAGPAAILGR